MLEILDKIRLTLWALVGRIEKLEARVAELEKKNGTE